MLLYFYLYVIFINIVAFSICAYDKNAAKKKGMRRIPEKNLFALSIVGGSIGMFLGMQLLRHKTKHWYFVIGIPIIMIIQIISILWLIII